MERQLSVKSVGKALDALDYVIIESIDKEGVSLGDVAQRLGIRNTTAHNILKTMEICGYISRAEGRLYCPGAKCRQLQRAGSVMKKLIDTFKPILGGLAEKTGESFVLTTLLNGERRVLLRAKGGGMISVETGKAETSALYSLVTTRIMLAFASNTELEFFVDKNGMPGSAWVGINDMGSMKNELLKIRKAGSAEEKTSEFGALAVPVLDADGFLVGAIGVYVRRFRYNREKKDILIDALKKASKNYNIKSEGVMT